VTIEEQWEAVVAIYERLDEAAAGTAAPETKTAALVGMGAELMTLLHSIIDAPDASAADRADAQEMVGELRRRTQADTSSTLSRLASIARDEAEPQDVRDMAQAALARATALMRPECSGRH
jgi:hypothetical protein